MSTDQELCRRAAGHDRAAFGALYERHADSVLRLLIFKGAARDTAWDLLQETFARALRAFDRGTAPDRFDLWIRRIALNTFADHWRRPYTKHEESTDPYSLPEAAGSTGDPGLATEMRSHIERLDPALRDALVLHVYQDLSVQDVAGVLGVPVGTVKSRLSRAYRKLGEALRLMEPPAPRGQPDERRAAQRKGKPEISGGRSRA